MRYSTVSSTYHIWLCSIVTGEVLVEKQELIKKLTRENEGELYSTISSTYHIWSCSIEKQKEIYKFTREDEGEV